MLLPFQNRGKYIFSFKLTSGNITIYSGELRYVVEYGISTICFFPFLFLLILTLSTLWNTSSYVASSATCVSAPVMTLSSKLLGEVLIVTRAKQAFSTEHLRPPGREVVLTRTDTPVSTRRVASAIASARALSRGEVDALKVAALGVRVGMGGVNVPCGAGDDVIVMVIVAVTVGEEVEEAEKVGECAAGDEEAIEEELGAGERCLVKVEGGAPAQLLARRMICVPHHPPFTSTTIPIPIHTASARSMLTLCPALSRHWLKNWCPMVSAVDGRL